jgi:hypothetical protein
MYTSREVGRTEEQNKGRQEGLNGHISINCIVIPLIHKVSPQLNRCIFLRQAFLCAMNIKDLPRCQKVRKLKKCSLDFIIVTAYTNFTPGIVNNEQLMAALKFFTFH